MKKFTGFSKKVIEQMCAVDEIPGDATIEQVKCNFCETQNFFESYGVVGEITVECWDCGNYIEIFI